MSAEFTASNGIRVLADPDGRLRVVSAGLGYEPGGLHFTTPLGGSEALREFFQHERDVALGRWRWTENPDWIVIPEPEGGKTVMVFNEATGDTVRTSRMYSTGQSEKHRAARAYFDAHPEPKPLPTKPGLYIGSDLEDHPTVWALKDDGELVADQHQQSLPDRGRTHGPLPPIYSPRPGGAVVSTLEAVLYTLGCPLIVTGMGVVSYQATRALIGAVVRVVRS